MSAGSVRVVRQMSASVHPSAMRPITNSTESRVPRITGFRPDRGPSTIAEAERSSSLPHHRLCITISILAYITEPIDGRRSPPSTHGYRASHRCGFAPPRAVERLFQRIERRMICKERHAHRLFTNPDALASICRRRHTAGCLCSARR